MTGENQDVIEITGIEHIGLAPKDPVKSEWFFSKILKLECQGRETVQKQNIETVILTSSNRNSTMNPAGKLEILCDSNSTGTISRFIEKKGGGIHHIALRVQDVQAAISYLKDQGIELINSEPADGVQSTKIAFVHPRSTGGILVELVECPK